MKNLIYGAFFLLAVPAQAQPTPFAEACPKPQSYAAGKAEPTPLDLYTDASHAYNAWRCAFSMAQTLEDREISLQQAQSLLADWKAAQTEVQNIVLQQSSRIQSNYLEHSNQRPADLKERILALFYARGKSLTAVDLTSVHSSLNNKGLRPEFDPDPARRKQYRDRLTELAGVQTANEIIEWERKHPPYFERRDKLNPVHEANNAIRKVISWVWNDEIDLFAELTDKQKYEAKNQFGCEFWGKRWMTFKENRWIENESGRYQEEFEVTRCVNAPWSGAKEFLEAFKIERDLACEMVHPDRDSVTDSHLWPRCTYPERLERQAIRDNLLPQTRSVRRYGQQTVEEAQAWVQQAQNAQSSLTRRAQAFEIAVLSAGADARVPYLIARYRKIINDSK